MSVSTISLPPEREREIQRILNNSGASRSDKNNSDGWIKGLLGVAAVSALIIFAIRLLKKERKREEESVKTTNPTLAVAVVTDDGTPTENKHHLIRYTKTSSTIPDIITTTRPTTTFSLSSSVPVSIRSLSTGQYLSADKATSTELQGTEVWSLIPENGSFFIRTQSGLFLSYTRDGQIVFQTTRAAASKWDLIRESLHDTSVVQLHTVSDADKGMFLAVTPTGMIRMIENEHDKNTLFCIASIRN